MLVKPHSRKKILSFAVSAALGVAGSQGWAQELEEEALDAAGEDEAGGRKEWEVQVNWEIIWEKVGRSRV